MSNKTVVKTGGVGFFGLLALIFITLKLTKVITWSWWAVMAPIWIQVVLVIIIVGIGIAVAVSK